jgi:hypothetical protein
MGHRLLFGSKSALARLGIVDGREIFPIRGAEDDDPAKTGEESDDDASDDDHDDDDDSEEDDKPAAKQRRNRTRTNEFNRLKRERNALAKEKADREKADRDAELKDKTESERAVAERDDAVKELTGLKDRYQEAVTELSIIKASSRSKFAWNDIEDVLNDRTLLKAIEIGDDGEITGVEEALKDLAKRKPHFLSTDDKGKGNGQQQNGNGRQQQPAGTKTGGQPNAGSKDDRAADRQRLNSIYPALQRLQ